VLWVASASRNTIARAISIGSLIRFIGARLMRKSRDSWLPLISISVGITAPPAAPARRTTGQHRMSADADGGADVDGGLMRFAGRAPGP